MLKSFLKNERSPIESERSPRESALPAFEDQNTCLREKAKKGDISATKELRSFPQSAQRS